MDETSRFIRPLLEFLFPAASSETLSFVHGLIRKLAHFVEYAVLALLAFRAFRTLTEARFQAALFAFFLAAAIALLDEFQQSFNPQRTSSHVDVLIDLAGAAAAIGLMILFNRPRKIVHKAS
jgi:VanZ family protein